MSTGVLFGLSATQIESFVHALEVAKADFDAAGTDERKKTALGINLARLIQHCEEIPRLLRLHCHSIMDMMPAHTIDDYEETGQELQRSFNRASFVLEGIMALAQRFQAGGGDLKNAENMPALLADTRSQEAAFFAHWPRFEPGDAAEALQAFKRGECVDVDDAFAQIKGVSREAWLQLVAQRKAQIQQG